MDRRAFLMATAAASAWTLGAREALADAIDVEKLQSSPLRSLFTMPWGPGRGQIGHSPARESAPLGPASLFVTADHDVHVLDVVNDRIVSFDPKGAFTQITPLPVKPGVAREFIDFAALEKNHFVVVERVSSRLLILSGGTGNVSTSTSFAQVPSMKTPGLVSSLHVDNGTRHWLEAEGRHHRVEPAKDDKDVAVLPGTPSPDGRGSLVARLERPRNVKIVRGGSTGGLFAELHFARDVGHVQSFDLTPLGGAWIAVETHEERKTAPFDILKTFLTVIQLAADGTPTARFKIPNSTDDGEVRRPSRLGRDGRFYALVRTKRGASVYVTP